MKWSHQVGLVASALTLTTGIAATTAAATTPEAHTAVSHSTVSHSTVSHSTVSHTAVTPHAVSPSTDTDIEGEYYWNGDGFTGSLDIYNEEDGVVQAELTDQGQNEFINGTWSQSSNELSLTRPLAGGAGVQYYTYFLGGQPFDSYPQMFGGYYTATGTSVVRGTYLDSALY